MILPDLILRSIANTQCVYTGMDSLERCRDKNLFRDYPHKVDYVYNSRGFRDSEWPGNKDELETAIWCVGDSFTSGLGSVIEHTWPWVLSKKINRRTINISMDGASNAWISRRAVGIIEAVRPQNMIVMWSYFHRRERADVAASDEERRVWSAWMSRSQDLEEWTRCALQVEFHKQTTNVVHAIIPDAFGSMDDEWTTQLNMVSEKLENFYGMVKQRDLARDGHHFDIKTSQAIAEDFSDRLV
jgi:hypothetical protein